MDARAAPELSVVVPFFTERESVWPLYRRLTAVLRSVGRSFELVFVDDGSRDGTTELLQQIQHDDPDVRLVTLRRNFGQTAALAAGFDHARGDVIVSMDGDLQHEPEEIPLFLDRIEAGYDIVSGWRKERVDNLWTRRLPSLVANRIMRRLSGVDLHDFGTTFKAYRREVIEQVQMFGDSHRFIPAIASAFGVRIAEIPIRNVERPMGRSKYGLSRTVRVLFDLITIKYLISWIRSPLRLFGGVGLLCSLAGVLIDVVLMGLFFLGRIPTVRGHDGLLLLSAILILMGVQFITFGLAMEVLSRIFFAVRGQRIYAVRETRGGPPVATASARGYLDHGA
jgi:glycosyltransferase involved in cell wall biosynthesis